MASPAQPCACSPYGNLCCCGTQDGNTVVQPLCQTLPDGLVVNNPAYVLSLNKSFWTYKFLTDCDSLTRGISSFVIPICREINGDNITVEERIDGCGVFTAVPFELKLSDPKFGLAPTGFQFLKVETDDRFDKGVSIEYRISIIGDYPEVVEFISLKAADVIYTFGCPNCYIVPGCVLEGKLLVSKQCGTVIINNQATLQYSVHVDNVGKATLDLVEFEDIVFIPEQLTTGTVTVDPATLNIDKSVLGQVRIYGDLGAIDPGGRVTVTYTIPIASISDPGRYTINNTAKAAATGTISTDTCQTSFDAVQLRADKCCSVNGSTGTFTLTVSGVGNTPDTVVDIYDRLDIPTGVTIQFRSLSGCEGYYAGTQNPIPLDTDITGPASFDIICRNALVPAGGSYTKTGSYILVSSSVVGTSTIVNSITNVIPVNVDNIIYKGTQNLPAAASIAVELSQTCTTPCV